MLTSSKKFSNESSEKKLKDIVRSKSKNSYTSHMTENSVLTENSLESVLSDMSSWTIHVETMPPLPDEVFYIKNVYGEQTISDFKKLICQIINRKEKSTRFFHEGQMMEDDCTLSFYNKTSEDVCIQHALVRKSKNTLIRWINAIN